MNRSKYLSESEKRIGQARLYKGEIFNGLTFGMLGDTIVYILAVKFGAGNITMGYIASTMYIVGFILPAMTRVFRDKNVIKLQTITWVLRGLVCLLYIPLIWIDGNFAVFLLLFVYTLFCGLRLISVVLADYTFKSITTDRTRGHVLGNINIATHVSNIFAKFFNFIVTSLERFSGVVGLVLLQMIGVVTNTLSAAQVAKIPGRTTIEYHKGRTLFIVFKKAMADHSTRTRLFVHWIFTIVTVVMGMSVAFLTKEVRLASNIIFLYTIGVSLALATSASFCKFFSDKLGSRPLIIANGFVLLLSLLGWVIVPLSAATYWFFVLGFISNFSLSNINFLIRRLLTAVIPDDDGVGFNSMVSFVISFLALFGGLAGGALATKGSRIAYEISLGGLNFGNSYVLTFFLTLTLTLIGLIFSGMLNEKGSYSTKKAIQLMFSLRGIRAFITIDRLGKVTNPIKQKSLLLNLASNKTQVATNKIRSTLASPFPDAKVEIIRGLYYHPRPILVEALIKEAFDTDSYTQIEAIAALGALTHNEEAEQALVYLLEHNNNLIRSTAAKSLARVTLDSRYLLQVKSISELAINTAEELNFLTALNIMDSEGTFFEDLFLAARKGKSVTYRQIRYAALAKFLDFLPALTELYEQKNLNTKDYLFEFLEEARDVVEIDLQRVAIANAFEHQEWSRIWEICFAITRNLTFHNSRLQHLHQALEVAQTIPSTQIDGDDALAALYFSYQLKKSW